MDENQTPNPWEAPQTRDPMAPPEPQSRRTDEFRPANFDTTMDIAKELWRDHRPTLLTVWGVFSSLSLVAALITGIGGAAVGLDPASQREMLKNMPTHGANPFGAFGAFGPGYWAFIGIMIVLLFVQMGVGVSTFGPLRQAWHEGRNLTTGEVLSTMGSRVLPGLALYVIFIMGIVIGAMLCCIPGVLAAYFLMPTFYLVGGRGDGIFDSVSTAFDWGKKYVSLLIIFAIIAFVIGGSAGCIGNVVGQVLMAMGKVGYVLTQLVSWAFGVVIGFVVWVYYASTMITIELSEEQVADMREW